MLSTLRISYKNHNKMTLLCCTTCQSYRNSSNKVGPSDANDQYIQKSIVPTFHFQKSLPRLPVPKLSDTCNRYLRAQRPILSDDEYSKTERFVRDFEKNDGARLQKELKDQDAKNSHTSYISKPWFDMYLSDRSPLPINYNPFLVFTNNEDSRYNDQLLRATNLVVSSVRFLRSLRENLLEPEVFHLNPKKSDTEFFRKFTRALPSAISWYGAYLMKAYPLDMSQYKNLFNATRIPSQGKDYLYQDISKKHIVVLRKGHFYTFEIIDNYGNYVDPALIYNCFKHILEQNEPSESPLGVLTTLERDRWAAVRQRLLETGNGDQLQAIDSALFAVCLDDGPTTEDHVPVVREFLHSDGTNRWFDKSFSLIVGPQYAGINFEHSWGDGVAVLRYFQDIHKDSNRRPIVRPESKPADQNILGYVKKLEFKLDEGTKKDVMDAKELYKKFTNSLDVGLYEFKTFGRNLCKTHRISPDCVMQLAFQLAHDKLARKHVATYESCSTAAFKHGRTETMRPCTIEAVKFCDLLRQKNQSDLDTIRKVIAECSKVHSDLVKDAAMGQGFDRHLFALNTLAKKNGMKVDLFEDPAFTKINRNILSTSTLSSDVVHLGAFGPVVSDGYGIAYSIWNDRLGAIVTNYKEHADGNGFITCLEEALNDLYKILK
ncbi:hypothetical protein LSTR_LSTR005822 [Laodelphax striatellus]|uniref:Choline/carnitine acyltransferase domain-containing protein n=1 Tax=Laodelphax striatellus TaxID=195883 RepID=A0A482WRV6_LAOST|nr:hypothetical protein LSTR_LSTR005822 [Laodelphax striatellus]